MYQHFFKRLYHNVYRRIKSNNQDHSAAITLSFTIDGKSTTVAENKTLSEIQALREMAEYHKPDSIMAEVEVGGKKTVYRQHFDKQKQTMGNNEELIGNIQQSMENKVQSPNLGYIGLGEISVKDYVNKQLEEERSARKMRELELELSQKKEEITNLNRAIDKLKSTIEENESEIEELQSKMEIKGQIRYWAGLTGDILESVGIKKESLKAPLAGLLASEEKPVTAPQQALEDQSGIVEEPIINDKRSEIIALIHAYLKQVDDNTLSQIFMIFSDIEQDKELAEYLINQIKLKKQN